MSFWIFVQVVNEPEPSVVRTPSKSKKTVFIITPQGIREGCYQKEAVHRPEFHVESILDLIMYSYILTISFSIVLYESSGRKGHHQY